MLTYTNTGGVPGNLAMRFVVAVNGVPFTLVLQRGALDADGRNVTSLTVPSGLAGIDLDQMSFTLDANQKVIATTVERLMLR